MGRCIRRRCVQRASSAAKGSRSPAHAHARVRWRADGGGASLAHSRPRCRPVGCRERRGISVLPAGLPEGRRAGLSSGLRILLSTSRRAQCTGSAGACAGRLRGALAGSSVCASAVAAAACRCTPRMAQLGPLPLRGAEAASLSDRACWRVAAHAGRRAAGAAAALQREKHRLENGRAGRGQTNRRGAAGRAAGRQAKAGRFGGCSFDGSNRERPRQRREAVRSPH